jgi:hypothetical protein
LPDAISRQTWRRARSLAARAGFLAMAGAASVASGQAAEPADADWPCIQRLVPELAASQMWAGPPVDSVQDVPGDAAALAGLAYQLASRSTPLEQAEQAIDAFADGLPPDSRNAQLTRLFGDTLALVNQERSEIIAGIQRYTRKQRRLAEKIALENQQLQDLQPGTTPDPATQERLDERKWDVRIFQDRQKILRQICDQPVQLEQRAFALARALQSHLEAD